MSALDDEIRRIADVMQPARWPMIDLDDESGIEIEDREALEAVIRAVLAIHGADEADALRELLPWAWAGTGDLEPGDCWFGLVRAFGARPDVIGAYAHAFDLEVPSPERLHDLEDHVRRAP